MHSIRDFSWLVNVFGYPRPEQAEACAVACEWLYWVCNYSVLKKFFAAASRVFNLRLG